MHESPVALSAVRELVVHTSRVVVRYGALRSGDLGAVRTKTKRLMMRILAGDFVFRLTAIPPIVLNVSRPHLVRSTNI
jgi:hypothetical protein